MNLNRLSIDIYTCSSLSLAQQPTPVCSLLSLAALTHHPEHQVIREQGEGVATAQVTPLVFREGRKLGLTSSLIETRVLVFLYRNDFSLLVILIPLGLLTYWTQGKPAILQPECSMEPGDTLVSHLLMTEGQV